jgi:hypothetical protein
MVLLECQFQMYGGHRLEVMDSIKQVCVNLRLMKGLKRNHMVKVIVNG